MAQAGYPADGSSGKEVEVQEVKCVKVIQPPIPLLPHGRLLKPHAFFPFDIFGAPQSQGILNNGERLGMSAHLVEELQNVKSHCMTPPFPWGHVMYRSFILGNIIQGDVPGDFAELGTGLGGTSLFFARLAKMNGRKFLAVDSFEGLPEPDLAAKDNHYFLEGDYRPKDGVDQLQAFKDYAKGFDVDDDLYIEKCFFKDLVIPPVFDKFAFVHLDSDLYDSVYDSLEKVWDRVSEGGCVAIDDFFHHAQGPARAVADFFRIRGNPDGEPPLLYVVPTYAVVIVKGRSAFVEYQNKDGTPSSSSAEGRRGRMLGPRSLDGNYYSFRMPRMCKPFVMAIEESARKVAAASQDEERTEIERQALNRARLNAEAFLAFLKYPENAERSGVDIMRYLTPLEDCWDMYQGTLNGLKGRERATIEIQM